MTARVVVIGAGLAGLRTVESLRAAGYPGAVTLVGDEPHPPYDRPPLSKQVLSGAWDVERALLRTPERMAELDVELRLGAAAVSVEPGAVTLADGTRCDWDALVVATGVRPRPLPDQPAHPRVHMLRTLDDCAALRTAIAGGGSLAVVGGGFVGAEVAATARAAGCEVTLIEALTHPLARVLGPVAGAVCTRLHEENGVRVRAGVPVLALHAGDTGVTVRLADDTEVRADHVVVGLGTVTDVGWLAGLAPRTAPELGGALVCDARGAVDGSGDVYAVGDVAAWWDPASGAHRRIEHWTSAGEQARVVGARIAGGEIAREADEVPYFWSDQYGLTVQLVGRPLADVEPETLHASEVTKGTVLGWFAGDRIVGVLAFGAPRLLNRYRKLLTAGASRAETRAVAAELSG